VRPGSPFFTGTGHYKHGHLRGDLTVSLPGADDVPLTPGDAELGGSDVSWPDCFAFSGE
jgi:hypothetical protein